MQINQVPPPIRQPARDFLARDQRMLIGSEWCSAESGATILVEDPATGCQIAEVPAADSIDVDKAVRAAREAFDTRIWRGISGAKRGEILWKISDLLIQNREKFEDIETLDNGIPRGIVPFASAFAVDSFRYYASLADKGYGRSNDLIVDGAEYHSYTRQEPIGVVGTITPWNGPLAMASNLAAPALAAGCSLILKPAEQTPLTTLLLGELFLEAGVPPGVVNILPGYGNIAGAALVAHPDVDKIAFVGSTAVGKGIIRGAADTMKRVTLELGGKSPVFIFDDAGIADAIPRAAMGIFANSGQVCFAGSRLYVQDRVYDQVVAGIADFARSIKVGPGFSPDSLLGPLISDKQRERVASYVDEGVRQGAELVTGGSRMGGEGYFFEPTVFAGADASMSIVQEEIFGPVLSIMRFKNLEDLEHLANQTRYGLGAGVFTSKVSNAHRAAKLIKAGTVWVNCYGTKDRAMPFGGFKQSGWGRTGGPEGYKSYFEDQSVIIKI